MYVTFHEHPMFVKCRDKHTDTFLPPLAVEVNPLCLLVFTAHFYQEQQHLKHESNATDSAITTTDTRSLFRTAIKGSAAATCWHTLSTTFHPDHADIEGRHSKLLYC